VRRLATAAVAAVGTLALGRWLLRRNGRRERPRSDPPVPAAPAPPAARPSNEEQLRQAQKMEAIGQLAGGVAHDFNNLLTVIASYTDLVLGTLAPGDARRDDLAEVKRAAGRAAALTRQLLAFGRRQVLRPEPLDLNDVVRESERMLGRLIGADIELVTRLAPEVSLVLADAGQIEQVIMNLAVNARDAMPDGGVLVIETANVELDEDFARRHVGASAGPHVMLAVTDTGVGMDEATRARVFEPFFTTKGPGKGTGLGLSTVYGIVTRSGGSVLAQSEMGRWTTIKVFLPVRTADASGNGAGARVPTPPQSPGFAPRTLTPDRCGTTVLLAEDEDALRLVARSVLVRAGYAVVEARDGAEALHVLEDPSRRVDLVLSDLVMPRSGGRALAHAAARLRPGAPLVLMSGYSEDSSLRLGTLPPGVSFLPKPFSPAQLLACVESALRTGGTADAVRLSAPLGV
jgi:two-component system, cell cycle sensor histidine kinase and response regulator CckA